MNFIDELTDKSEVGIYEMTTASGSFYALEICTDRSIYFSRTPGPHTSAISNPLADPSAPLRRDNEKLRAIELAFRVGYPGLVVLEGLGDLPYTIRNTTAIMKIERK